MSGTRHLPIAALAAVVLGAAGCGSSSSSSTTPTTTAATHPAAATLPSQAPARPKHHRRVKHKPVVSPPASRTATAPAPPPPSTPPAPDGLSAATGYGSYDDCQGTCSGSVPASLRRPLHLPTGCAPSRAQSIAGMSVLGAGPVGPAQPSTLPVESFIGSSWAGARVTWVAAPSYRGAVLIRGRELGGPHAVGFGSGHVPVDELQLLTPAASSGGAREWPSFTRVRGPGCYAYQIDGTSFSTVVVFRAG